MNVKALMKPLDYHIESDKIRSSETADNLGKNTYSIFPMSILMSFIKK